MQSAPGLHDFASSSDWFIALHVRRVSCDRPDAIRALVYVLKRLLVKRCLLVRRFLIIRKKNATLYHGHVMRQKRNM